MDSFLNAVARREVDSMASGAIRVRLHKPDISSRLGLTLAQSIYNSHVEVNAIAPNSIASDSGLIKIGQLLYAVNGVQVEDHEEATSLLRASHGMVELTLSRNVIRTEGLTQTAKATTIQRRSDDHRVQGFARGWGRAGGRASGRGLTGSIAQVEQVEGGLHLALVDRIIRLLGGPGRAEGGRKS